TVRSLAAISYFVVLFFSEKATCEMVWWAEFRRVLFRSRRRLRDPRGRQRAGDGCGRDDDREPVVVLADRVADVAGQVEDDARDAPPVLTAADLRDRVGADGERGLAPRVHRVLEVDDQPPWRLDPLGAVLRLPA